MTTKMIHKIKNNPVTRHTTRILSIKLKVLLFVLLPFVTFTLLISQTDFIKGVKSFTVVSGSMEPAVPVGSIVYTQQKTGYAKGDVISFKNKTGQTVTHRVDTVKKQDDAVSYLTKGDANKNKDTELVSSENVLGKMVFHVPYVGLLIGFIKTPTGFALFIIVPAIIFVLSELWNIKREIEKEVEKRVLNRLQNNQSST